MKIKLSKIQEKALRILFHSGCLAEKSFCSNVRTAQKLEQFGLIKLEKTKEYKWFRVRGRGKTSYYQPVYDCYNYYQITKKGRQWLDENFSLLSTTGREFQR